MKTIKSGDLESLWFDSADGAADWGLTPHPRIWGAIPDCLSGVLGRCPDSRRLSAVLLASHLVYPHDTPPWARTWLTQAASDLLDMQLDILEQARWRLAPVPVAAGDLGRLHVFLVGAGDALPDGSAWNGRALAADSHRALELVRRLVRRHANQESCCLFLGATLHDALIEGESLGLPCYLAAMAAAGDLPLASVLATGRLDEDGRVLPVECLVQKLDAAGEGVRLFLYPDGCAAPEISETECVAVTHVREAVEVMACFQPGLALKIAQAERVLDSGQGMAREMCSFASEMVFWIRRNRERIGEALHRDPHLDALFPMLERWTDSTQRLDMDLGNAILDCLSAEHTRDGVNLTASAAWDLCALQIGKANHRGDLASLRAWTDMADTLRPFVAQHDDCARMLILHHVHQLIGEKHNAYAFSDPIEDDGAVEEIRELEQTYARQCQRRGPCANAALGKYYGTLGQHYGFLGPKFIDQALTYLDKAIACFCGDESVQRDERDRDRLYRFFALSSAGRADEAERGLREVGGLWRDDAWTVDAKKLYQLHALLRLHVDAGRRMDSGLWDSIRDAWQRGGQGHPGQLISYNLGLLAPNPDLESDMLRRSVDLCLDPASGPTIQVMALLPLARLYEIDPSSVSAELVERAMVAIRNGEVSTKHFRSLVDAPDWTIILRSMAARRAELFPFSYR